MAIRFDDRVAVVTGAGSGLGRSHAMLLAARGAKVVVNDPGGTLDGRGGSHSAADAVVAEIRAAGGQAVASYDSVSSEAGARRIIATAIDSFGGRVDILVNNAGILRDKTLAKMPLEDFRTVVEVHLLGSVYCTHAAWPFMKERGYGRIVMTSSGAGLYGSFGQSNYGAAKAGVLGLMNVIKLEGQRSGIYINAVAPIAATRMTEALYPKAALPHLRPEYVSAAVAYLSSAECLVTGHVISAGGGYFARAQMVEADGVWLEGAAAADPDAVAHSFDAICDLTSARGFVDAVEYTEKVLGRFGRPGA